MKALLPVIAFSLVLSASAADAASECQALAGTDFSGIQDAPTKVTSSKPVEAANGVPGYCRVEGYVIPQVGFELRLPLSGWNGKLMEAGCGGWCGSINASACDTPLQRGYACIASDMGHKGTGIDVLWACNNLQAQVDFGYRATHVAALTGKALTERFYGKPPKRSYYVGCSTGGYQGVTEAQRFPWDFDGIIAGAPDIDQSAAGLRATWIARTSLDPAGKPVLTPEVLRLVHTAALAQCDMDDGLRDGIIGNSYGCKVDLRELICKGDQKSGCLTPSQAETVTKLYEGATTSKGELISTLGYPPGSELMWGDLWPPSSLEEYYKFGIANYTTPASWKYTDFDFDRDFKRVGLAAHYENSNPDLRRFKRAGGKLIVYHGGNDTIDLPGPVIDYYETVERTMGGRAATQDFFRLFIVPGMNHCYGGDGAYAIDYLSYLEAWVECGQAPDKMIGAHLGDPKKREVWVRTKADGVCTADAVGRVALDPEVPVAFTRPIYPYPTGAKYLGHGNPKEASSFGPVEAGK